MSFDDLALIAPLLDAVRDAGYREPTPIQTQAIPLVMEGHDVLGCAQTGTGKTAAFALPILQRLVQEEPPPGKRPIRALVLTPTRELTAQIADSFETYARHLDLRVTTVFGGVPQRPQVDALRAGVDVVAATPGRLLDLMQQRHVDLSEVRVLVLDEADRMLDMGFIPDVQRIVSRVPKARQSLLFSATMPHSIQRLAGWILVDPVEVSVAPSATTIELIEQSLYYVEPESKVDLLLHLLEDPDLTRVLVFARTRRATDRLGSRLRRAKVPALVIHGDRTQKEREEALESFRAGDVRVLLATDLASRGLDVVDISHVINVDVPDQAEVYVHRIGRTGRAGASGGAVLFCSLLERPLLGAIERLIDQKLPVVDNHPFRSAFPPPAPPKPKGWVSLGAPRLRPASRGRRRL